MRLKKREKSRGFTMIEMVITLAVVAILAAVLVPLISNNIQSARFARAGSDVSTIGKAIVQFRQDTGQWPIYDGTTPRRLLYSDRNGVAGTAVFPAGPGATTEWADIAAVNSLSLSFHLVSYNIGAKGVQRGPSANPVNWNGPYLSMVQLDPWGNSYMVNAEYLGGTNSVYVISAGSERPALIDQTFNGNPPADSNDVFFRIQ